jgi:hypothetical protein
MEKVVAQHFTELRKAVSIDEMKERLEEIIDDLDANPGTVYHVVDENNRAFVLIAKKHYDALIVKMEGVITTPSAPSDTPRT